MLNEIWTYARYTSYLWAIFCIAHFGYQQWFNTTPLTFDGAVEIHTSNLSLLITQADKNALSKIEKLTKK